MVIACLFLFSWNYQNVLTLGEGFITNMDLVFLGLVLSFPMVGTSTNYVRLGPCWS